MALHGDNAWIDYAPGQAERNQLERNAADLRARIAARPELTRLALAAIGEDLALWRPTARLHPDFCGGMWRQTASIAEARALSDRLQSRYPGATVSRGQWTPGLRVTECRIVWFACDRTTGEAAP